MPLVNVYPVDSVILPYALYRGKTVLINYGSEIAFIAFGTPAVVGVGPSVSPNGGQLVLSRELNNFSTADIHAIHAGYGPSQLDVTVSDFSLEDLLNSALAGGTLDSLSNVLITNKQNGDSIEWDAGSGKWVNAAASGGADPNMGIGAAIELSAIDLVANAFTILSLDDSQPGATLNFLHGLTLNEDQDGYIIGTKGRYVVAGWMAFGADLSTSFQVTAGINPTTTNSSFTTVTGYLQVLSAAVIPSQSGQSLSYWQLIELDVGDIVQFWVYAGLDTILHDSLLSIQYIGPAVSL